MSNVFLENLNYGRFETWTSRPEISFHEVKQVHGTEIVSLETLPAEADGMVVSWEEFDKPLAIKTADCMPIIIEGAKGAVFLHAGWRGLASGIIARPEIAMINPQRVLIGPSIHQCCFEVSEDFRQNFPDNPNFTKIDNRLTFNLQQEAKDQLRKLFPNLLVDIAPICTCCNPDFHSYRRDKTTQRNWNFYIKG
jgi:polyphenol oxidase